MSIRGVSTCRKKVTKTCLRIIAAAVTPGVLLTFQAPWRANWWAYSSGKILMIIIPCEDKTGSRESQLQFHQPISTFNLRKHTPQKIIIIVVIISSLMNALLHRTFTASLLNFSLSCLDAVQLQQFCPFRAAVWPRSVTDTVTPQGVSTRFPPLTAHTKPPHWEDSADVTGGVNRRGRGQLRVRSIPTPCGENKLVGLGRKSCHF